MNKNDKFSNIINHGLVLIDTCFILHEGFQDFMRNYKNVIATNPIIILDTIYTELQNISKKDASLSKLVKKRSKLLTRFLESNLLQGRKDYAQQTSHVDQVFLRIVQQYHPTEDICILTNDKECCKDIYRILDQGSNLYHNHRISVLGLRRTGNQNELFLFNTDGTIKDSCILNHKNSTKSTYQRNSAAYVFRTNCTIDPEASNPTLIPVSENIQQNSTVYFIDNNQYQPIQIKEMIGSPGGEGTVYRTSIPGIVCKIYHKDKTTNISKRKIELMVTHRVNNTGICWPISAIYDKNGVFRGYLMNEAKGQKLSLGIFQHTWRLKHPNWTRVESVKLVLNILKKISYLHEAGILLGDINENNILFENENSVYFVDCDSFQVEGFPCGVGTPAYVAPEIQGVNFQKQLRTENNELFAVAILLFMIMVPGKHPYSHQGGGDYRENIKKGHFPYPLGENHSDRVPEGPWKYCWSHLSRPIKEEFYNCFRKSILENNTTARPSVKQWIRLFNMYLHTLQDPSRTYMGPKQNYGFDLQVMPQNIRRIKELAEKGDPFNQLRKDGRTDLEVQLDKIANMSSPASSPASNYKKQTPSQPYTTTYTTSYTTTSSTTSYRPSYTSSSSSSYKKPAQQQSNTNTHSYQTTYSSSSNSKPQQGVLEFIINTIKGLFS